MNIMFSLFGEEEKSIEKLSLRELEDKVFEITKRQNLISHFGLSKEVTSLAIEELQIKKHGLLELMHKKVDEL